MLQPAQRDSILNQMDCNGELWSQIFTYYRGDALVCADYLFGIMTLDDREDMTLEILEDHVYGALEARMMVWDTLPDSVFLPYLLQYSIKDEPLSPYRILLHAWWNHRLDGVTPADIPSMVAESIRGSFTPIISTVLQSDLSFKDVLDSGEGTPEDLWILTGASLRSLGIPVRPVQGWYGDEPAIVFWHDFWTDSGWHVPIDPEGLRLAVEYPDAVNVTDRYTVTGALNTFPLGDFDQGNWSVSIFITNDDDTLELKEIEASPFRPEEVVLGPGSYLIEVSFTHEDGRRDSWLDIFQISADSITTVYLSEAIYQIIPLPQPLNLP